jgi:hypothetical protein
MTSIRIAPIVEGHGEVEAVPILLRRIWSELVGGAFAEVLKPIRQPRSKLFKEEELARAVALARGKLDSAEKAEHRTLILATMDSNGDCPAVHGPRLLAAPQEASGRHPVACVLVKREFETWFVAAAESLQQYLTLDDLPEAPEEAGYGKGWIRHHFAYATYSETTDQPALTATMDLALCRRRSPSFDKLCRELERWHAG